MDVIPFISKPPGLPDLTPDALRDIAAAYACGPNLHAWLRELHDVLAPYDAIAIGEAFGVSPEQVLDLIDARRGELNLALTFDIVRLDRDGWRKVGWRLPELKAVYARLDRAVGAHGWNSVYLENHDSPRVVSHFGDPDSAWRERSARVLAMLLLTQRGTPFLYQGQEIGMANFPFRDLADFADVEVSGQWHDFVESGKVDAATFLMHLAQTSRDNARTPMQWTAGPNAGFTSGAPWLAINPDHATVNVERDTGRSGSVFETCRALIALRRAAPDLVTGDYLDLDPDHPHLFAYRRGGLAVVLNLSRAPQSFALPAAAEMLFATDVARVGVSDRTARLEGWEGLVVRLV